MRKIRMVLVMIVTLVMVTLVSAPVSAEEKGNRKTEEIALIAAAVADAVTTEIGASRGAEEANWAMGGSTAQRLMVKAGTTSLALFTARWLDSKGMSGKASAVRWTVTGIYLGAAGWNVSVTLRY